MLDPLGFLYFPVPVTPDEIYDIYIYFFNEIINDVYSTFKIFWERLISINQHYNVNTSSVGLVKIR